MDQNERSLTARSATLSGSLVFSGFLVYVFMAFAKRQMSPIEFSRFSVFWSFGFFLAATVASPLEQEVSRLVAHRLVQGHAIDDVVKQAALFLLALDGVAAVIAVFVSLSGVLPGLDGHGPLLAALLLLLAMESVTAVVRGVLAGLRATEALSILIAVHAVLRAILVIALVLCHLKAQWVAFGVGASAATSLLFVRWLGLGRRVAVVAAGEGSFSPALALRLVAAAPFAAIFSVGTPALASAVAYDSERANIGDVLAALSLTSAPVLIAVALQMAIMPPLVGAVVAHDLTTVRRLLRRALIVIFSLAVTATVSMGLVGGRLLNLLFGPTSSIGRLALMMMTMGAGLLFMANLLATVCVASKIHVAVTRGWFLGANVLVGLVFIPQQLDQRVGCALLGGAGVATVSLLISLRRVYHVEGALPIGPSLAVDARTRVRRS